MTQLQPGARVRVLAGAQRGQEGTVSAVVRERGCSCSTVFVRLERREWAGKPSELAVLS